MYVDALKCWKNVFECYLKLVKVCTTKVDDAALSVYTHVMDDLHPRFGSKQSGIIEIICSYHMCLCL